MIIGVRKCAFRPIVYLSFLLSVGSMALANEMPLEGFPASGIVVRDEKNIRIEREDLYISNSKVEVSYVFRNYSDKDITTEVAFPIPRYSYEPTGRIKYPVHGDFSVEVNGVRQKYNEITRAIINDKDYTDRLKDANISIKDFNEKNWGHYVFHHSYNLRSKAEQQKLIDAGLVKIEEDLGESYVVPAWSVETTYFWSQVFPAKTTTIIKHAYTPNASTDMYYLGGGKAHSLSSNTYSMEKLSKLHCLNGELTQWAKKAKGSIGLETIDYILTTANHWKQPIGEFHLIIEGGPELEKNTRPSTCFEGKSLVKVKDNRYEITIKDFVPREEVKVYFLHHNN